MIFVKEAVLGAVGHSVASLGIYTLDTNGSFPPTSAMPTRNVCRHSQMFPKWWAKLPHHVTTDLGKVLFKDCLVDQVTPQNLSLVVRDSVGLGQCLRVGGSSLGPLEAYPPLLFSLGLHVSCPSKYFGDELHPCEHIRYRQPQSPSE